MKSVYNIICIILINICTLSCITYEHEYEVKDDIIYFGNITYSEESSRSSIIRKTHFDEDDTILFNSFGGHPNKGLLTFNGKTWNSNRELKWNSSSHDSIHYTAFHPAPANNKYSKDELYPNGILKDILFCKSKQGYKNKISLEFSHLFSVIDIEFGDFSKNTDIQSIDISVPVSIDSIEIQSGEIHINEEKPVLFTLSPGADNSCHFYIPPIKNLAISIRFNTTEGYHEKTITNSNFEGGNIYTYNFIRQDKNKGIKDAEDFIAFSFLINGMEYNDRQLEEFYYVDNGKKIFSLLENITFTNEQCQQLKPIGTETNMFNDIFDGRQNSISKLEFKDDTAQKALFSYVGTNGVIKNLTIENSSIYSENNKEIALLACYNNGVIGNCMINNCQLESAKRNSCCFVAYYNKGTIVNSKVCRSKLTGKESSCNCVFTKTLEGSIINCYSSDNSLSYTSSGIVSGFVFNPLKGCQIKNCYVKCYSSNKKDIYQYSYFSDMDFETDNCFMYKGFPANEAGRYTDQIIIFDDKFKDIKTGTNIDEILNKWIDDNQGYYPQLKLKRWKRNTVRIPGDHIE